MTPAQCRAARGLVDISQSDLARAAVVPAASIADFETGAEDRDPIQGALERAGVEFIERGVREKADST